MCVFFTYSAIQNLTYKFTQHYYLLFWYQIKSNRSSFLTIFLRIITYLLLLLQLHIFPKQKFLKASKAISYSHGIINSHKNILLFHSSPHSSEIKDLFLIKLSSNIFCSKIYCKY